MQNRKQPAPPASRPFEVWYYFGPAFVASVAYIDPGNFAANIEAGSAFGYQLLWVLFWSNLMAILVQYLSAKLGVATGLTLPQNCRRHFPRWLNYMLWVVAEIAAMATDLAEFLGAALGFYLLFHIPLGVAGLLTGVVVFAILAVERAGFRRLEYVIIAFVVVVGVAYAVEMVLARPDWAAMGRHLIVPEVSSASIYLAVAMLGATVMPHVVYLHSALVLPRRAELGAAHNHRHRRLVLADVLLAMNGAWLINSAMVVMAAAVFFQNRVAVQSMVDAHQTLIPLLGGAAATTFAIALLCSGLASSTVGTMAGQVIIEGFLKIRFSIFLRRLITMVPAMAVIVVGLEPMKILVLSQVCLSFCLPFAVVPLVALTWRRTVMGELANRPLINVLALATASIVIVLNALLLYQVLGGRF
ncbi:MAG: Nramp family divalent metal transporter [Terriglobia bacterium]